MAESADVEVDEAKINERTPFAKKHTVVPVDDVVPAKVTRVRFEDGGENSNTKGEKASLPNTLFFRDGKRRIDYVLAYTHSNSSDEATVKKILKRQEFEKRLTEAGLDLEHESPEHSIGGKTCFVKLHGTWSFLCTQAEILKLRVPLKAREKKNQGVFRDTLDRCLKSCNPFELDSKYKTSGPEYYTAVFDQRFMDRFVMEDEETFFTCSQRSRMVWDCLIRTGYDEKNTQRMGIQRLIKNATYEAAYPLHEDFGEDFKKHDALTERQTLYLTWARPWIFYKYQPFDLVRKYFGEKIALYFGWLGFYTKTLFFAAIAGIISIVYGAVSLGRDIPSYDVCNTNGTGNTIMCPLFCDRKLGCSAWNLSDSCRFAKTTYVFDNTATVVFAIFMSIWATLFLEGWKRRQAELAWDWDLNDGEFEEETIRPEFAIRIKTRKLNPVTQEFEPHLPYSQKVMRLIASGVTVIFCLCLVLAFVFGVIVYRVIMVHTLAVYQERFVAGASAIVVTSVTAAVLNLLIIMLLDYVYQYMAWKLTNMEYPRTDQQFEDSYTFKVFLFQFINYYSSLFYIAFFKGRFSTVPGSRDHLLFGYPPEACDPAGCMVELLIQLAIIMVGKQFLNNCMEIIFPILTNQYRKCKRKMEHPENIPRWEKDFRLNDVPPMNMFGEYMEMVLQYGFITLFVAAFPLAPLFALINNIIEIRLDAYKWLVAYRRPMPARARNIGVWYRILDGISHVAVLTNACVIAFTSDFVPRIMYQVSYSPGNTSTLSGYVENTLSRFYAPRLCHDNSTANICDYDECRYRDYRNPPCNLTRTVDCNSKYDYAITIKWWHVFAARLAFVLVFEHFVFFLKGLVAYFIPDVPAHIAVQIQREKYLAKQALYGRTAVEAGKSDRADYTPPKAESGPSPPGKAAAAFGSKSSLNSQDFRYSPRNSLDSTDDEDRITTSRRPTRLRLKK